VGWGVAQNLPQISKHAGVFDGLWDIYTYMIMYGCMMIYAEVQYKKHGA
jgi:hypothetical protein